MRIERSIVRSNHCKSSVRQGSVYIAVMGTAMLLSVIGFTAIHLSRLELRSASAQNEQAYARQLAQSGVEFALSAIDDDPLWRDTFIHGVENVKNPLGFAESISFILLDNEDNNLADDITEAVEIQGIGRYGSATSIYSVAYAPSNTTDDQSGQIVLSSFDSTGGHSVPTTIYWNSWIGQYFVPALPAEATEWSVTKVDIYAQETQSSDVNLYVLLYEADGLGMPAAAIEAGVLNDSTLPNSNTAPEWVSVNFATVVGRLPGTGLCLGLQAFTNPSSVTVQIENAGVTQTNAHMIDGASGSWTSSDANQALWYRVHGVYTTSAGGSGEFTVTPGSWQTTGAP